MLTYKNIETIIETFATSHGQIRNEHQGTPYDVDEIQQVDGAYMVWDIETLAANGNNGANWNMRIFFMSQVTEINNETNESNVKNESILQAMDFLAYLDKYNYSLFSTDLDLDTNLLKTWNIAPFLDRFNSLYAGATLNVSLNGQFNYDRCTIPNGGSVLTITADTTEVTADNTLITADNGLMAA